MKREFLKKLKDQLYASFYNELQGKSIMIDPSYVEDSMTVVISTGLKDIWFSIHIEWSESESSFSMYPGISHVTPGVKEHDYLYQDWLCNALSKYTIDVTFDIDSTTLSNVLNYIEDWGDLSQKPVWDNLWFCNMTVGIDVYSVGKTREEAKSAMASRIITSNFFRMRLLNLFLKDESTN
jgi:hypothetical protein